MVDSSSDTRSCSALATAIDLSEDQLIDCCHPNPQKAAVLIFFQLYLTYHAGAKLIGIKKNFSVKITRR